MARDAAVRAAVRAAKAYAICVPDLQGLRDWLGAVDKRLRRRHPLYCVLLYAGDTGLDRAVSEYVRKYSVDLDAMTGSQLLMFAIEDQGWTGSGSASSEVYAAAHELGVRVDALPCIAFFTEPDATRRTVTLRLRDFIPSAHQDWREEDVAAAFRAVAAAATVAARAPRPRRLDVLREELRRAHERAFQATPAGSASAQDTLALGTSVLNTLRAIAQLFGG